jgi:SAM-dependent methyltransferase
MTHSRRDAVPFDPRHFERLARAGEHMSTEEIFRDIHRRHHWAGSASPSGAGAAEEQVTTLRTELPALLADLGVRTLLDLPCGDFSWMATIDLPVERYIGADLLPELIAPLRQRYDDARRQFTVLDLTRDPLPAAELLLCRDCLVHLSLDDIRRALRNVARSPIAWLLTTTFPDGAENEDIVTGDWRVLDLERPPFSFPPPIRLLNEGCTEGGGRFTDKSLGLWWVGELAYLPMLTE